MRELHIRNFGTREYSSVFSEMRKFTQQRTSDSTDEIWCLQHPAVLTLGANASHDHILSQTDIPIVQSDRGGQVTYHAPGQAIIYLLLDLRRMSIGVKRLVQLIEQSVVDLLNDYNIESEACAEAHGVYVKEAKIASLGLRVHSGCSYHGVALNVDMDMRPFSFINPCGFPGLAVTQLKDQNVIENVETVSEKLTIKLCKHLNYKNIKINTHGI